MDLARTVLKCIPYKSQSEHSCNLSTHFYVVWCQIEQRGKLLCLVVSNLDLIELQIIVMVIYIVAYRFIEVAYLSAEANHAKNPLLYHIGSNFPVKTHN